MKIYSVLCDGFHLDNPSVTLFTSEEKALNYVRECWGSWCSLHEGIDETFPEPSETWAGWGQSLLFTFEDGFNNEWYYVTEHDGVQ